MIDHFAVADKIDDILSQDVELTKFTVCLAIKEIRYLNLAMRVMLSRYDRDNDLEKLKFDFRIIEEDLPILSKTIKRWNDAPEASQLSDILERLNFKFVDTNSLVSGIKLTLEK